MKMQDVPKIERPTLSSEVLTKEEGKIKPIKGAF